MKKIKYIKTNLKINKIENKNKIPKKLHLINLM